MTAVKRVDHQPRRRVTWGMSLAGVHPGASLGTAARMETFDIELYALICESLEVRFDQVEVEDFTLATKAAWLVRPN